MRHIYEYCMQCMMSYALSRFEVPRLAPTYSTACCVSLCDNRRCQVFLLTFFSLWCLRFLRGRQRRASSSCRSTGTRVPTTKLAPTTTSKRANQERRESRQSTAATTAPPLAKTNSTRASCRKSCRHVTCGAITTVVLLDTSDSPSDYCHADCQIVCRWVGKVAGHSCAFIEATGSVNKRSFVA